MVKFPEPEWVKFISRVWLEFTAHRKKAVLPVSKPSGGTL